MTWRIVVDPSGHHRPVSDVWIAEQGSREDLQRVSDRIVDSAKGYLEACRKADDLNMIAKIMES